MYKIIGGDGQEYGPVTEADLCKWIAEGRLNAQSLAKAEGEADFRPLSAFPEFAGALGTAAAAPAAPPSFRQAVDWSSRDYELDIGGCISRGWNLFTNNLGILLGSSALCFVLIIIAAVLIGSVSAAIVNNVVSTETRLAPAFQTIQNYVLKIVIALVVGPLTGGLYYVFIQTMRGRPPGIGDLFAGFQKSFWQLFIGNAVISLALAVCFLPVSIVVLPRLTPLLILSEQIKHSGVSPEQMNQKMLELLTQMLSALSSGVPVFLVCLVPWFYLVTNFQFTLPLIIDRGMDFWTAIKTSWRMVHKHWFTVFGLSFLSMIIFFSAVMTCCIGMPFTMAIATGAIIFGYETIFGDSRSA